MFQESKLDDGDMRPSASGSGTTYEIVDPFLCFDGKKLFQTRHTYEAGSLIDAEQVDVTAQVREVLLGRLQ